MSMRAIPKSSDIVLQTPESQFLTMITPSYTVSACLRHVAVLVELVYAYVGIGVDELEIAKLELSRESLARLAEAKSWLIPNIPVIALKGVNIDWQVLVVHCRLKELQVKSCPQAILNDEHIQKYAASLSLDTLQFSEVELTASAFDCLRGAQRIAKLVLDVKLLNQCMEETVRWKDGLSDEEQKMLGAETPKQRLARALQYEQSNDVSQRALSGEMRKYLDYGIFQKLRSIPGMNTLQLVGEVEINNLQVMKSHLPAVQFNASTSMVLEQPVRMLDDSDMNDV